VKKLSVTAAASARSGRSPPVTFALNVCVNASGDRGGHSPVIDELCGSDLSDLAVRRKITDRYELARVRVGKWLEKHGVHDAEHRRVEGYAQRQRQRGNRRECPVPEKRAYAQSCVAAELLDEIAHARMSPLARAERKLPGTTRARGGLSGLLPASSGRLSPPSARQLAEHFIERTNQQIRVLGVERHGRPDLHDVVVRAVGTEEDA
jgi:hypothetical protein